MALSTAETMRLAGELAQWRSVLNNMRRDCLLYVEFSTLENIDLLGEDFIRRMKRELSPQTFNTAILNKRIRVAKDGFYGALDEDINLYTAPDIAYLDNMRYDLTSYGKRTAEWTVTSTAAYPFS